MARLSDKNKTLTFVPAKQSPDTAGFITETSDDVIPDGWLECDGTAVSRTTYSELFDLIGTTYGVGDGSTTFNLPTETSVYDVTNFTVIIKAYTDKTGASVGTDQLRFGNNLFKRKVNTGDYTVPSGYSASHEEMTVKAGTTVTVEADANLTVQDELIVDGDLVIEDTGEVTIDDPTDGIFPSVTTDLVVSDSINTYWQEKALNADITTIVDFLEFTTEIGKTYKYSGTILIDLNASGDDDVSFEIKEGGTIKRFLNFVDRDTSVERRGSISFTYLFTATTTSVKLRPNNLGAGATITANFGAGLHTTWAILEELPNHVQTSKFN